MRKNPDFMTKARQYEHAGIASPIFHGMEREAVESVLQKGTRTYVRPHTHVCTEGEPAAAFFLILEGELKYCRATGGGKEILIGLLSKDDCFGLGSFVRKTWRYLGTAETVTFCDIVRWSQSEILHLSHQFPQLADNAMHIVMRYLAEYSRRHAALVEQTAQMRLAHVVLDLASRIGKPTSHGIEVRVSNDDLGALADVSRFTTSRTVADWSKRRVIKKQRNSITLVAPEGLVT
jgi:CRP-like cAMP-binding protein